MNPVFEDREEMKLVGVRAPFRGVFDDNPNNHEVIPELWQSLVSRLDEISSRVKGFSYGVVECHGADAEERLTYLAAVEVDRFDELPQGMSSFVFPAGKLIKFTHRNATSAIEETVKHIFGTWLPQSGVKARDGLELEIYPAGYDPRDPGSCFEYCLLLM